MFCMGDPGTPNHIRCDGKRHRYTPDVLVVWGPHHEVVEIKEDREAELAESRERFALISQLLGEHGYPFRLWKASESLR